MNKYPELPWTPLEQVIVAEAWDVVEAVQNYRLRFGNARSFGAIKMQWYRAHYRLEETLEDPFWTMMLQIALDALEAQIALEDRQQQPWGATA